MTNQQNNNGTPYVKHDAYKREWYVFNASGKTLGRLASEIAKVLRGKHKPTFAPHQDLGDGVIVTNAKEIVVSGVKDAQKLYRNHTGFRLNEIPYRVMLEKNPGHIITHAVKGMMPKGPLGRKQMKRLKVFAGDQHQMEAQQPLTVNI
jgi:large subunit ribosomal protein L13